MKFSQQEIFEVVKQNSIKVLMDVDPSLITLDTSLTELGANSIDRVEVVMYSMEQLGIEVPRTEFRGVRDIRTLVDLLHSYCR
ncbi:phosphopantetheine-binding protein [Allochromatium humboldtianum]|uniref:Phosphopantetheine-binding protein n=1 Tax=Allochromatium humboldtianum TaxID=504901 RepID=A0A850RA06_9GAMM|nr:phosphopantetheine-binding protein [Allochromatium humboldtianum]NVZ10128.1 phosphopantetheine-binding protein [Allochromatium humboldtianum]